MSTEKIEIYYCEQGDPHCAHPKCLCNTPRPKGLTPDSPVNMDTEEIYRWLKINNHATHQEFRDFLDSKFYLTRKTP